MFPIHRARRLRYHPVLRELVRETHLSTDDLIMPIFIKEGRQISIPIASMPQNYQLSLDNAIPLINKWINHGIKSVILFGVPDKKDERGSNAMSKKGIVYRSISKIKKNFPQLFLISDLCFCEYTSHGHCGKWDNQELDNDSTLEWLGKQAVLHAEAGVDMIAPSGMVDGMVATIRKQLDLSGYTHLPIMSYAVKFASSLYGPFREAAGSNPIKGTRQSYQMDPSNQREAIKEALYDLEEGADVIMVKPALPYLDVLTKLKDQMNVPLAAYQVSGEFSMIKAAGIKGWIDEKEVAIESLLAMKRAGANLIISYFTQEIISFLND